ncbi:SDR family oxidoreductase [Janthinobacterium sp. Mn2066]|uniref:SDR family oxidoreductase n=1 Tax=Janthinobacterium sp. Mn2066 TaxID=3395264 RepID=UPI003BE74021
MPKTIFITGASSGIGKAAAKRFAEQGWNVVATLRNPADETELCNSERLLVTRLDVQDKASIGAAVDAAVACFGGIDVLVNNAGFSLFGVFEALSPQKIQEQFAVNVFGLMDVTRALLPVLRQQGGGTIINVSSSGGVITVPLMSMYHATKFAVEGFSESLSYELASQNISVKLIEPGAVRTQFGARMFSEFAHDPSLASYDFYIEKIKALYAGMLTGDTSSAEQVADVIFGAATDRSARLRYVIGEDIAKLVRTRREMGEESYLALMREQFLSSGA